MFKDAKWLQMQITNEFAAGISGDRSRSIFLAASAAVLASLVIGLVVSLRRTRRSVSREAA